MGKRRLFEVEILDTRPTPSRTIWKDIKAGRYPKEAMRKAAKMHPKVDFSEFRTPKKKHSRYVFMTGEVKVNEC